MTYKKYTLGRNLETTWLSHMFSFCTICVSEEAKRLIMHGELAADTNYLINHSGTYDGITIDRPEILPLAADVSIGDIDHRYIRAKGHVKDGHFEAGGRTFAVNLWNEGDFEVVGFVYNHRALPLLQVSSYKRIAENEIAKPPSLPSADTSPK